MATLVINRSESYCDECPVGRREASPYEPGHITIIGYTNNGEPGCGQRWTAVSTDYVGPGFDDIGEHYFGFENLRGLPIISWSERANHT